MAKKKAKAAPKKKKTAVRKTTAKKAKAAPAKKKKAVKKVVKKTAKKAAKKTCKPCGSMKKGKVCGETMGTEG